MTQLLWIDAFAEGPFSGNPAAVCILDAAAEEGWMRGLAFELGISETAFARREGDAWRLRWFTPEAEVKLCGHATLATAAALLELGLESNAQPMRFQTLSGELRAWRRNDNGLIELDFPEERFERRAAPDGLLAALGLISCADAARAGEDWLLEAPGEDELRLLAPDFEALKEFGPRGVCVTAKAEGEGADFVSRFFGPAVGVNEDPVTGSAHCYLGPWWAEKLGRSELMGRQLSRRGGLVQVSLKHGRAFLAGSAAIILKGQIA